ncbi:MAG TPA: class I SAM-dependent methyltransferase [Stellaceae bacterium]|jgi:SAM-dependent methyltransferase
MSELKLPIPACPITGSPAKRLIQRVSARLVGGLWRHAFGISADRQLDGIARFGLWESACGLAFFDPMIEGDESFYRDLYRGGAFHRELAAPGLGRAEFKRIADIVRPREKVLDVGCGEGGLARHIRHATYIGLDPNFSAAHAEFDIRNETAAAHSALHGLEYDAVCAFHVIEHVSDPLGFARGLADCIKPGGRLFIAVPSWPSPFTDIPNFVFNAPPHHLSWWNEGALRVLAGRLGLDVEEIQAVPFASHDSILCWMGRFAPKLTGERYFRAHYSWYAALAWAGLAGCVANALFRLPASAASAGLLLVARKPLRAHGD